MTLTAWRPPLSQLCINHHTVITARGHTLSSPRRLGLTGSFNQPLFISEGKQIGHSQSPAASLCAAPLNDSLGDNLQQRQERDVDIARGLDPLISGATIAFLGRVGGRVGEEVRGFTKDASELISVRTQQMLRINKHLKVCHNLHKDYS